MILTFKRTDRSRVSSEVPVTRLIRLIPLEFDGFRKSKLLNGPHQIIMNSIGDGTE